jgi:hypothetical protein
VSGREGGQGSDQINQHSNPVIPVIFKVGSLVDMVLKNLNIINRQTYWVLALIRTAIHYEHRDPIDSDISFNISYLE